MGSQHQPDAFSAIPLPPTQLHSRPAAEIPTSSSTNSNPFHSTYSNDYFTPFPEQPDTTVVKKEGKTPKTVKKDANGQPIPPKVGKKRGQYKKTILRKQAEAEAAAAAAAAAAGAPYNPPRPLSPITSTKPHSSKPHSTKPQSTSSRPGTVDESSTVESLSVQSQRSAHETPASRAALEMERELAMLAEEAEEDRRRREEEAADRILKRAQVVKVSRAI